MREVFVNMGQIQGLVGDGVLTTVGLGSCVGWLSMTALLALE